MNKAAIRQARPDASSGHHAFSSRRFTLGISIGWAVSLLLVSWWLSSMLHVIRGFEDDIQFHAHNRTHWFRPIAFFWFHRFHVLPSLGLAIFIFARHAVPRCHGSITWALALFTLFLLAVGAYTVWEQIAMMHQFVR